MKLEVLLSVLNLDIKSLDNMNITSDCLVINQCGKDGYKKLNNFKIYNYNELGHANSCNRGLEKSESDIILLCDDDVKYNHYYEKKILYEYNKLKDADIIIFNVNNNYRKKRFIQSNKRLHFYNILRYASYNISFKKDSIKNIKFNNFFGAGAYFSNGGDDTIFLIDCLKKGLKIYSSPITIGNIVSNDSTWFKGYNKKYFFDKGALYTHMSKTFKHLLFLQHLIRHREVLTEHSFIQAYKEMIKGSKEYLKVTK
jgi:hypothetical protein